MAADPTTSFPFVIWITYPEQGFLIRYAGINDQVGDSIRICPLQTHLEIRTWDTEESSYEEFIEDDGALAKPFSLGPQPIDLVTDFEILTFYETFKDANLNTCFDTPTSIWPH